MAGDWIAMRTDLYEDPAVIGIALAVRLDEFSVVGRLHRLWSFANYQTCTGQIPHITAEWIDKLVQRSGFAQAMIDVGWLSLTDGNGVLVPLFDRWMGQSAKRRLLETRRKSEVRKCPHDVRNLSASDADKMRIRGEERREEKRREEKSEDFSSRGGIKSLCAREARTARKKAQNVRKEENVSKAPRIAQDRSEGSRPTSSHQNALALAKIGVQGWAGAETTVENSRPASAFVRPEVDEVRAYCAERGNAVDPQAFVDHYESNGWRVGRSPMKDWRAAVRTWERNDFGKRISGSEPFSAKLDRAEAELKRERAEAELRRKAENGQQ